MRIAFDLDGTIADLRTPFIQVAARLFPELDPSGVSSTAVSETMPIDDLPEDGGDAAGEPDAGAVATSAPIDMPMSRAQTDAVWKHIESIENFWETLPEIEPGSIARLAALADERRWEVIFLTSRPHVIGRTVQRQSQRWLERHGFPQPSLFVVHRSRGHIASSLALDVVVDDRAENCLDVALESKAGAILVWRGGPPGVVASAKRMGIGVVPTIDACLAALVQVDRDGEGRLLDRVRKMFGLRARAPGIFR